MCLPGEILDLWIRYQLWNLDLQQKVGYMEAYTLQKLKDAADSVVRNRILERLELKFKHCRILSLPIYAREHWALLQLDQEERTLKFADSLNGPVYARILEAAGDALKYWKQLPCCHWVPTEVPQRWNKVRQGPLQCGFFVATWLERSFRKAAGKPCLEISDKVDVEQLKGRFLKMLDLWGATMKRLQGEITVGEPLVLEDEARPAEGAVGAALEDMHRAAGGFRAGEEPTGAAAMAFRLEDYANEDDWATAVIDVLSVEHKEQCTEVALKVMSGEPCSRCTIGCRHCVFWKAVRYWRNIETGGKATEGYDKRSCSLARLKGNVGSQVDLTEP